MITKLTRALDVTLVSIESVGDKIAHLNVIYEQLQNKLNILQKGNDQVLTVCSVDHIEREIEYSEAISTIILDYKRQI